MNTRYLMGGFGLVMVLAAAPVLLGQSRLPAGDDAPPRRPGLTDERFDALDTDGDGRLSVAEVPERMQERFDRLDTDGDGFIDRTEQAAHLERAAQRPRRGPALGGPPAREDDRGPARAGGGKGRRGDAAQRPGRSLLAVLDTDGDGTLSSEEISRAAESLKTLDTDGDGTLSKRELPGRPAARPGGQGRGAGLGPRRPLSGERLAELDVDGDGLISRDEMPERLMRRFEFMDGNGDDVIDQAEQAKILDRLERRSRGRRGDAPPGRGKGREGRQSTGGSEI